MRAMEPVTPSVAIVIPCLDEERTIASVVAAFRAAMPAARLYVIDNGSTDRSATLAREAGAIVLSEPRRGKGNVVQRMFAEVDADVCVMVDGDETYPVSALARIVSPVIDGQADMVVGSRLKRGTDSQFHLVNWFGNVLFVWLVNVLFGARVTDLLSGYRAFSRRFVQRVRPQSVGFEIETELTLSALRDSLAIVEVPVDLRDRPAGSCSKLRLLRDGLRILWTIVSLAAVHLVSIRKPVDVAS